MRERISSPWAVLVLVFFVRITIGVQFMALPGAAPYLVGELGLSYTQLGVLTGLFMSPGVLMALPGGLLANRFGGKTVMVVGLGLMAGGMVCFTFSTSYAVMALGRIISGVGGVMVNVHVPKIVTDRFAGGKISTGLAVSASGFGFGTGLGTGTLGVLAGVMGWRNAILVAALLPAVALPVFLLLYDEKDPNPLGAGGRPTPLWGISNPELAMSATAGMANIGFVAGYSVFMGFAPTLLIQQGLSVEAAGGLVGLMAFLTIVAVPLGGFLADVSGHKDALIVGGAVGTAAACLMLPLWGPPLLWILTFGLLRGGCTGGIHSLPGEVLRPRSRSTGFGVFYTFNYLGMAALVPLGGWILDRTGDAAWTVWFAGLLWLSIVGWLALFRLLQKRWPASAGMGEATVPV